MPEKIANILDGLRKTVQAALCSVSSAYGPGNATATTTPQKYQPEALLFIKYFLVVNKDFYRKKIIYMLCGFVNSDAPPKSTPLNSNPTPSSCTTLHPPI